MLGGIAKAIFGSSNDRYVKSLGGIVGKIAAFEPNISALGNAELAHQTDGASVNGSPTARRSTTCFPKLLRRCAKRRSACSDSVTTTSR